MPIDFIGRPQSRRFFFVPLAAFLLLQETTSQNVLSWKFTIIKFMSVLLLRGTSVIIKKGNSDVLQSRTSDITK